MVSLALDPPPSNRKQQSAGRPLVGLVVVLVLAVTFGAGFWVGRVTGTKPAGRASDAAEAARDSGAPPPAQAAAAPQPAPEAAQSGAAAAATPANPAAPAPGPAAAPAGGVAPPAPLQGPPAAPAAAGPRRLSVTLSGPLEDGIASALGRDEAKTAAELTQVVNRLLVWDLLVARDARKGDRLDVLWQPAPAVAAGLPPAGEPVVEAVRYASQKLGAVVSAYRFQPPGARFARYYRADGTELEPRLVDAPIGEYEQVTSLLRDGRRHKGVDFKTPVGSPVFATFDGVVERRNWNFAGNGNCLDVRDARTGRHAIFLHLDVLPKDMAPGRAVKKGQVIAASGNSGHSFAPHLHYQLEASDGRVLDPFEVHETARRVLDGAHKPAFDAARSRCDAALGL